MIQFPCHCGHTFTLDDDQAGGLVQCPDCGRLNDVPTHADLANVAEDGTLKLGGPVVNPEPGRLEELRHVYRKGRTDVTGGDIDLRNTQEDLAYVVAEIPLKEEDQRVALGPKYDPETGELIQPIDVSRPRPGPPKPVLPASAPTLGYARAKDIAAPSPTPGRLPAELLRPVNLFVMFCTLCTHAILNVALFTVISGIAIIIMAPLILMFLMMGHYGAVVDETGPEQQDELPRPLRSLSWHDDLWGPFVHVAAALMVSFLPGILAGVMVVRAAPAAALPLMAVLLAAGLLAFPAVLLTTTTSGTVANLRPDRVAGVITRCGPSYPLLVLEAAGVFVVYGGGILGSFLSLVGGMGLHIDPPLSVLAHGLIAYPLLCAGIYLAHLFCWHLGLLYRAHHDAFPWVLQRFTGTKREAAALYDATRATRRHEREVAREARRAARRFWA